VERDSLYQPVRDTFDGLALDPVSVPGAGAPVVHAA
jgi:hypothetical protein